MKKNYQTLISLAASQGGHFTAAQANAIGISRPQQKRYADSGEWTREAHGIYRLTALPDRDPEKSQYHQWMLWSIGRDGKRTASFSYETVLAIFQLSDLIPTKIHISVPKKFRRALVPKILNIHYEDRDESDIIEHDGLRVIRPLKAMVDMIREERVSAEHIEKGFKDGFRKGIITEISIEKEG
ncbi:MAG: type IV toxin-antitoxin system AbiEi family antitoxin domain-containing protein, partial [Proteobacteria bacterium]|nr:type IV toxin-antitoxin system AbiEi family antitoxin domain-containing protein [Pseudomonadota bacterium]